MEQFLRIQTQFFEGLRYMVFQTVQHKKNCFEIEASLPSIYRMQSAGSMRAASAPKGFVIFARPSAAELNKKKLAR